MTSGAHKLTPEDVAVNNAARKFGIPVGSPAVLAMRESYRAGQWDEMMGTPDQQINLLSVVRDLRNVQQLHTTALNEILRRLPEPPQSPNRDPHPKGLTE